MKKIKIILITLGILISVFSIIELTSVYRLKKLESFYRSEISKNIPLGSSLDDVETFLKNFEGVYSVLPYSPFPDIEASWSIRYRTNRKFPSVLLIDMNFQYELSIVFLFNEERKLISVEFCYA